ncbi:MtrAB system histidine kinase MtrB [Microbacterium sp. YY-01]|uniref:MtrAB system histidine kinase MtrB n=1 Tax=Microbacterium sp. YY-01 TaxID=3421634 RepID=UPI003D1865F5
MSTADVGVTRAVWAHKWRTWNDSFAGLWRGSLRFRTLAATLALTSLAIIITCVVMALAIQGNLWESRKGQVLEDAHRAVNAAQATFLSAEVRGDRTAVHALIRSVSSDLEAVSSSDMIAVLRTDDTPSAIAPPGFYTGPLTDDMISPALRRLVSSTPDRQWWQSMGVPDAAGAQHPAIIVGQQIMVPEAGAYELYIVYDLADTEATLQQVQKILWAAGIVLVAIIAGIAWFALRSVVSPVTQAAETSARFAAGDLTVRLPVQGEDELATLARSFNAMADSIEAQIKELGELSLVQQRFVSDVSHELRTPLTTIRLAADMLNDQRDTFDATTARTAELLFAQVQRFDTMLADLLEISRYDAGSVQLEQEPTSLAQLAEDMVEQLQPLAEQHATELRLLAPGGHTPVDMDPRRVRRILRNLIGNAIEHGEGHPVVITVDSNPHAVAVGVRDFGLGMRAEDSQRVFDRFWRADPSRKRTIGGTGLGLSIAQGDARLHGGVLSVWSELGVGTHFVLTLPRGTDYVTGPSPIAVEPVEALADIGEATEPITVLYRDAQRSYTQAEGEQ